MVGDVLSALEDLRRGHAPVPLPPLDPAASPLRALLASVFEADESLPDWVRLTAPETLLALFSVLPGAGPDDVLDCVTGFHSTGSGQVSASRAGDGLLVSLVTDPRTTLRGASQVWSFWFVLSEPVWAASLSSPNRAVALLAEHASRVVSLEEDAPPIAVMERILAASDEERELYLTLLQDAYDRSECVTPERFSELAFLAGVN